MKGEGGDAKYEMGIGFFVLIINKKMYQGG